MKDFQPFRAHPWHGLPVGPDPPRLLNAYIEITPFDLIKYEVDKETGYLKVDRPQRTSSQPPSLYGFVPKTFCGETYRKLSPASTRGDGDPLDICVISERPVTKSDIIVSARPIGGLQMVDHLEADDKIVAVMDGDFVWGNIQDIRELPSILLERLQHYFLTYKIKPNEENKITIECVYDRGHALRVIEAAMADYKELFAP